ncbi:MAG: adenosine kinase [Alphaproteobacteria bacterium]|nr:adenosine kinase [Alphaproteobacteria bacterium]
MAPAPTHDVLGIGNAIVDVIGQTDDAFLSSYGLVKGAMTLVDAAGAKRLYDAMGPATEMSGGSAANTIAGLASLGGRGAFIGKISDDQLGGIFRHDITSVGIDFATPPAAADGTPTGMCLVYVTPDGERTMQTFLGVCGELGPEDIDGAQVAAASVTYLEGYLWDPPDAREAFFTAATAAHEAGRRVALTLSDPFVVDRHRTGLREFTENHVDILFANEAEITSLYEVESFDSALQHVRGHCEIAALTRSAKGSVIVSGDEVHIVDAEPVAAVIDTTGAGDLYAAGFLHGLTQERPLAGCARIGSIAAAEIISHIGARPQRGLAELVAEKLG